MSPIPDHLMHSQELPISTQGKKRLLCIPHSLVKAERLATQAPLGEGKGPSLFLKQKRSLTLVFPKGGRKSLGRTEEKSKGPRVSEKGTGVGTRILLIPKSHCEPDTKDLCKAKEESNTPQDF